MDWFLYDNALRHERVNEQISNIAWNVFKYGVFSDPNTEEYGPE